VGGGISLYTFLGTYKTLGPPVRRDDGKWIVRDICFASAAIALGECFAAIEDYDDPERRVRVAYVFEGGDSFETIYEYFERGEVVPIRKFLDSFFALYHIAKSRPGRKRRTGSDGQEAIENRI
jgi:hypothetical protein